MKRQVSIELIRFLLVLLFVYAATSKLSNFGQFKQQMENQTFPLGIANALTWLLPSSELIVSALLIFKRTLLSGLIFSLILMICFTGYVGLVLTGIFGRTPCSCGGVIGASGWKLHFFFNLFYLLLSSFGIYLVNGERRMFK